MNTQQQTKHPHDEIEKGKWSVAGTIMGCNFLFDLCGTFSFHSASNKLEIINNVAKHFAKKINKGQFLVL